MFDGITEECLEEYYELLDLASANDLDDSAINFLLYLKQWQKIADAQTKIANAQTKMADEQAKMADAFERQVKAIELLLKKS